MKGFVKEPSREGEYRELRGGHSGQVVWVGGARSYSKEWWLQGWGAVRAWEHRSWGVRGRSSGQILGEKQWAAQQSAGLTAVISMVVRVLVSLALSTEELELSYSVLHWWKKGEITNSGLGASSGAAPYHTLDQMPLADSTEKAI